MDKNQEAPFVIVAQVGRDCYGNCLAVPVGVELASSTKEAYQKAIQRWPDRVLLRPEIWEALPPDFRLQAIAADREM